MSSDIIADQESAYATALVRSLKQNGVKFLRYFTIDLLNTVRCKVVPLDHITRGDGKVDTLQHQVSLANVSHGGMPSYADMMISGTGIDARDVVKINPDLFTLNVLPYNPKSAIVLGTLEDPVTKQTSGLCTRGRLMRIVKEAAEKHNVTFSVGGELEFILYQADAKTPIDNSLFAGSTTLNNKEDYITELYDSLTAQNIDVELIHAESGPGQLEIVLAYQHDPVKFADNIVMATETIRAVAAKHSMVPSFLPKYDWMKAGSGMHVHMSICDATTGKPLFAGDKKGEISTQGGAFLEGILQHLPALLGVTLPTPLSHMRVGKGCWTGSSVTWAVEDKEMPLRVCRNLATQECDHFEYKLMDQTANIYMALTALFAAGMEGIDKKMPLRAPHDYSSEDSSKDPPLPSGVLEALDLLEKDQLLCDAIGPNLTKSYLALRRHEAERLKDKKMEEIVQDILGSL